MTAHLLCSADLPKDETQFNSFLHAQSISGVNVGNWADAPHELERQQNTTRLKW